MASTSVEESMGGLPFFVALSLLGVSVGFWALCAVCSRKHKRRLPSSQADQKFLFDGVGDPPASEGLALHRQQVKGRNSGEADQRPTAPKFLHPLDEGNSTASSHDFVIVSPGDLPRTLSMDQLSPGETYSHLNFSKGAEEMHRGVKMLVGDERKSSCFRIDKIKEDVWVHQDQAAVPSCERVLKRKETYTPIWVKEGNSQVPPEPLFQTDMALPLGTKPVEEMYSVVCKKKKKKKAERSSEGRREKEAAASQGVVHPEPTAIAGYQSSATLTSGQPFYESISFDPQANAARKDTVEPAYESVDIYWKSEKQHSKLKKSRVAENLYESIENVAFRVQNRMGASHFES